ncbi:MAG: hypothetical protein K1000chlam2_01502 [Chlamydiae bacterium]|nr:hypothetical protein [Chlamydiota bacterium]
MRYTITSQQLDYFRREGHIEFETLFSVEEAEKLRSLLDTARLSQGMGRDLERGNPPLRKAMELSRLGQTAYGLFAKKPLRLAFSQYVPQYRKIIALEDISSVTETYGCMLLNLSPNPLPDFPYLPMEMGDVGFYERKFPIDFTALELPVLFLAFARDVARYQLQENDPDTHHLKKLGYGFGDRLNNDTHPLIIK